MNEKVLNLKIILPDDTVFDDGCDHVIIPGRAGDFGISQGHTPIMSVIRPGILEVFIDEETTKYALHDGFVSVENDRITIVCETIEKEGQIDRERARKAKERAEKRLRDKSPDTDFRRAEIALKRALIRLEL